MSAGAAWCDACRKETTRYSSGKCHSCARRKANAGRTEEWKAKWAGEYHRAGWAALQAEAAALSAEERRERARRRGRAGVAAQGGVTALMRLTTEERRAAATTRRHEWCDTCQRVTARYSAGACRGCAMRLRHERLTPEQRAHIAERAREGSAAFHATLTPAERSARAAHAMAARAITPEQQSEFGQKGGYRRGRLMLQASIARKRELVAALEAELAGVLA